MQNVFAQEYAVVRKMMHVGDLIAIMEECDFDTIDTDSLEFEVNTAHIILQFIKTAIILPIAINLHNNNLFDSGNFLYLLTINLPDLRNGNLVM